MQQDDAAVLNGFQGFFQILRVVHIPEDDVIKARVVARAPQMPGAALPPAAAVGDAHGQEFIMIAQHLVQRVLKFFKIMGDEQTAALRKILMGKAVTADLMTRVQHALPQRLILLMQVAPAGIEGQLYAVLRGDLQKIGDQPRLPPIVDGDGDARFLPAAGAEELRILARLRR